MASQKAVLQDRPQTHPCPLLYRTAKSEPIGKPPSSSADSCSSFLRLREDTSLHCAPRKGAGSQQSPITRPQDSKSALQGVTGADLPLPALQSLRRRLGMGSPQIHVNVDSPPSLLFLFGRHLSTHKFMATVEIHGAIAFILV